MGFDLDMSARITEELSVNAGFGYTDSEVKAFPGPSSALVVGSKAPLVSDYTLNVGAQWLGELFDGVKGLIRVDYNRIGRPTFVIPVPAVGEPTPIARRAVDLVDLRAGLKANLGGHVLVEEPVRQEVQHRILDRRLPLQGAAAALGYRSDQEVLTSKRSFSYCAGSLEFAAGAALLESRSLQCHGAACVCGFQPGWTERRR